MKAFFLIMLSLFASLVLSTANDFSRGGEMGTMAVNTDMSVVSRRSTLIPEKLFYVTVNFALFNKRMRPKFEDGTIVHSKYKKKVQSFARRAQKVMLDDLKESEDETVSARSISTSEVNSDSSKLFTTTRDACSRCQGGCAAAAFGCRRGCVFTGPEGVVECEIAWAGVAAGCYGVCAKVYC